MAFWWPFVVTKQKPANVLFVDRMARKRDKCKFVWKKNLLRSFLRKSYWMSPEMSKMWHRQNTRSLLMQYKVCDKGIMVMMMMIINNINNIGSNDDKINSDHHHHHLSELRRRPREGSCNIRKIKPIHLLHSCIRRLKLYRRYMLST